MEYLPLIVVWILWCVVHSAMASLTVQGCLKDRLGGFYRFYRLFYNLVALTTLIPVIHYSRSFKGLVLFRWEGPAKMVQVVLLILAMSLFVAGGLKYDLLQFLGIRQIKSGKSHSTLSESGDIDSSGILSLTRHPWYLAAVIFIWIYYGEMYVSTLIVNIILTVYLVIGAVLEERKLIIEVGDSYRDYQDRVSMLFPFKWIFAKVCMADRTKSADR